MTISSTHPSYSFENVLPTFYSASILQSSTIYTLPRNLSTCYTTTSNHWNSLFVTSCTRITIDILHCIHFRDRNKRVAQMKYKTIDIDLKFCSWRTHIPFSVNILVFPGRRLSWTSFGNNWRSSSANASAKDCRRWLTGGKKIRNSKNKMT